MSRHPGQKQIFVMSRDYSKKFVEFDYVEMGMVKELHLEHARIKYITQKRFEKYVLFAIEPVISGLSGRTGKSYRSFTKGWVHSISY